VIHGNGSTRIDYSNAMVPVAVDLRAGVADARLASDKLTPAYLTVGSDTFTGVAEVRGSAFDDSLLGGGVGRTSTGLPIEIFTGNAGNDTINGLDGWDVAAYGNTAGPIQVSLPTGTVQDGWGTTDTVIGIEEFSGSQFGDVFLGDGGDQTFNGSNGVDTMDGGTGHDEVGFHNDEAGVTVHLGSWVGTTGNLPAGYTGSARDGWGNIDVFRNIEGVEGSAFNDLITGDGGNNRLDGRGGNDTLEGGAGSDWAEYNQAMSGIHVDLSLGTTVNDGQGLGENRTSAGTGTDTLNSIENVQGGYGNDLIIGDTNVNELLGGAGDDTLEGGAGNDTLSGNEGYDTVRFSGNKNQYTVVKDNTTGDHTVTDTVNARHGVDLLKQVERLQFADGETILVAPPSDNSIRIDLNGSRAAPVADYDFSPFNYYSTNSTTTGYSRSQPNPFYAADLQGTNGIKVLQIDVDKNASDLGTVSLDWRFGWHATNPTTGEIGSRTAKTIAFGADFTVQTFSMGVNGQNIPLKVSPVPQTIGGRVVYGLRVEAENGSILEAETMQAILQNIGLEHRAGASQGAVDHVVNIAVKASSNGSTFTIPQAGDANTLVLEVEGLAPSISAAYC